MFVRDVLVPTISQRFSCTFFVSRACVSLLSGSPIFLVVFLLATHRHQIAPKDLIPSFSFFARMPWSRLKPALFCFVHHTLSFMCCLSSFMLHLLDFLIINVLFIQVAKSLEISLNQVRVQSSRPFLTCFLVSSCLSRLFNLIISTNTPSSSIGL